MDGCVLEAIILRMTLGIVGIRFTTRRQAAIFAQRHANGKPAVLRIFADAHYQGDRPIPPRDASWVPEDEEEFYQAFLNLPFSGRGMREGGDH